MKARFKRVLTVASVTVMLLAVLATAAAGSAFSHIKCGEFAYGATAGDAAWMAAHYDWVGLDGADVVVAFKSASMAPVWAYVLFNSIVALDGSAWYDDYTWLHAWCDSNGVAWENMFVHFSVNTRHRPTNESSSADTSTEDKFSSVFTYNGSSYTDYTTTAYAGGGSFPIGTTSSWILYVGSDEPFAEANFVLATPASADWAGTWEYWNGSTWAALSPTDGTSDMTASGKVSKSPPPLTTWRRTTVNEKTRWWWRLRCTSAGRTQPVVASGGLRGRNYITLSGGYYTQPGWADANDPDGDGYAEDPTRVPTATARFRYEARACYYELYRYYLNMGSAACRTAISALTKYRTTKDLGGGVHYDSLFLDNAHTEILIHHLASGGTTIEDTSDAAWQANSIAMLTAIKAAVGSAIVFINTAVYCGGATESFINAVDGYHGEGIIRPERAFYPYMPYIIARGNAGKWGHLYTDTTTVAGDLERGRIVVLAMYYVVKAATTYLQFGSGHNFKANWYGALEYNVGQPKAAYYTLYSAPDPSSPGATAYMYAREFDNALVVVVPCPEWNSTFTPSYTVALPTYSIGGGGTSNRYQCLRSDGTIDATVITQITLRNAEGAILVKTDLSPPAVTVSKASDRSTAAPGDVVTYTLTYRNDSAGPIQNVVLTDAIPEHTAYVPNSTKLNSATVSPDPYASGQVSVPIGSVASGVSGTVVFQVTVD